VGVGVKPYYQDSAVKIYHGDCLEVLPALVLQDYVIVSDPPFGIAHESGWASSWGGSRIANDESTVARDWLVTHAAGRPMALFGTWKQPRPNATRQVLIFDKGPTAGMGDLSFPWKNSFEEIYVLGDGWTGRRDEGVLRGFYVPFAESAWRCHPNEKPVALLAYLISKHTCGLVLDPFMGSGTTLRAAKDLGRKAIGIEIEERYCEIAARRMGQEVLSLG
jgi:DNA modification methylase